MNNKKYKYVVFDFDGVVCDSTNECMVTSWNAWDRWNNGNQFRKNLNEFNQIEIDAFRPLRPYVRGASEYYIIMRVINSSNVYINNQKDFEKFAIKWQANLKPFQLLFFQERKRLKKMDSFASYSLHSSNAKRWLLSTETHWLVKNVYPANYYFLFFTRVRVTTDEGGVN